MSFWSRVKGRRRRDDGDRPPAVRQSQSCDGLMVAAASATNRTGSGEATARVSLAQFLADIRKENTEAGGPGEESSRSLTSWSSLVKQRSRLSKSVKEFLVDPNALGYLIQFLETRNASQLVKFWLDVESFRLAASHKISSGSHHIKADAHRLECVPEVPDGEHEASPSSPASLDNQDGSLAASESAESYDSGYCKSSEGSTRSDCGLSLRLDGDGSYADSVNGPALRADFDSLRGTGTDGFSEIFRPQQAGTNLPTTLEKEAVLKNASGISTNRTEDAVNIYKRYIAPDSVKPVAIPTELKKEMVELICHESGLVSPHCFDQAQVAVEELLERDHFPHFLQSEFNAKHQVDILTGGQVFITDILFNDTALFHFMEFMESLSQRPLVEFWMAAINFQQSIERVCRTPSPLPSSPSPEPVQGELGGRRTLSTTSSSLRRSESEATLDAMVLYDKFFSMQASMPLGFDDKIRLEIEKNICEEGGPGLDCFALPLELIARYLEQIYLQPFLNSKLFHNYVRDLIATIQLSPRAGGSTLRRSTSSESISSCGSTETTNSKVSSCSGRKVQPPPRNTLLASGGKLDGSMNMSIDSLSLSDPDSLWRRKPIRENVGRVDSLGRYCPGWDEAPDTTKMGVLSMAAKRLTGAGPHQAKLKEEMAWQVAESFIRDVTSITMSPENSPQTPTSRKLDCSATSADFGNCGLERSCLNGGDFEWDNLCLGNNLRKSKSDTFGLGYF